MKRALQSLGVIAGLTLVGGCASQSSRTSGEFAGPPFAVHGEWGPLSLTLLGPSTESGQGDRETYLLGAGDALGRAVFANYVAYVRENGAYDAQRYASGESRR